MRSRANVSPKCASAPLAALVSSFFFICTAGAQWVNVGVGIDYQKFTTADPNNVFVTRMAVSNTNCIIGSMIAQNRVAGATERVSSQASRYEDAINYWGESWGKRNDVVVAINGSFYSGGVITGGHIYDGWYAKRFDDWSGQMGFVWKMDRTYFNGVSFIQLRHYGSPLYRSIQLLRKQSTYFFRIIFKSTAYRG